MFLVYSYFKYDDKGLKSVQESIRFLDDTIFYLYMTYTCLIKFLLGLHIILHPWCLRWPSCTGVTNSTQVCSDQYLSQWPQIHYLYWGSPCQLGDRPGRQVYLNPTWAGQCHSSIAYIHWLIWSYPDPDRLPMP